eukprot:TRINITY_DN64211_c0_g1_i1.p1 TRINITY_DN64211_c0_g1~~TRINITY_DN64211_c0_g1_i1.p1  ORF type:complete len:208 (-),score=52.64 TRINITY_DN64211_c0_g1_i1:24-647(-)
MMRAVAIGNASVAGGAADDGHVEQQVSRGWRDMAPRSLRMSSFVRDGRARAPDDANADAVGAGDPFSFLARLCGWLRGSAGGYQRLGAFATDEDADAYMAQRDHDAQMKCIGRAMRGEEVSPSELLAALRGFSEEDAQAGCTSKASLRAMFYFADTTRAGNELLAWLDAEGRFGDGDDGISFESLVDGILKWRARDVSGLPPASDRV